VRNRLFDALDAQQLQAMRGLRAEGRYFWLDLSVSDGTREALARELGIPDAALDALFKFRDVPLRQKYRADAEQVVFAFHYVARPDAPIDDGPDAINLVEVHVLVHGDYLLTVHREPAGLQAGVEESLLPGRDERYLVFAALLEMTGTLFDALTNVSEDVEDLESRLVDGAYNPASDRRNIPVLRARLTTLRRVGGRQQGLFARVAGDIAHVRNLEGSSDYFGRIDDQLARLVGGVDAAGQSLASLVDQGLNGITLRLTVVATIFLPLTVITGFFGMNFGWLVDRIGSGADFVLLGIGAIVAAVVIALTLMRRDLALLWHRRSARV
jgi:magnesium transporter